MLESMEKFEHLVVNNFFLFLFRKKTCNFLQPGTNEQREKLYTIISNLEEQQASYTNLLNLITVNE